MVIKVVRNAYIRARHTKVHSKLNLFCKFERERESLGLKRRRLVKKIRKINAGKADHLVIRLASIRLSTGQRYCISL